MFAAVRESVGRLWAKRPGLLRGPGLLVIAIVTVIAVLFGWNLFGGKDGEEPYRTAAVDRGAVVRVVSATGALEPLVSADVGSTVSGPVLTVEVDFNSQVRAGQVLARLDPTSFQQRVVQAQATLAQAQAQLAVAEADYQRYERLQAGGFASEQLMAQQRAARDTARAAVSQAQANLVSARTDLDRTVIRSPIDGVVVNREVNVGQSVAASFQAPTLFIIAQDLSRLQANITVDEADIGEVREDMPVRFTVDAFPDREFEGRVSQVRQQGVSESGVVSYTVVVEADNPGRRLLPGMTANAEIVIQEQPDVLRVPNAALRFRPTDPRLVAQAQALTASSAGGNGAPSRQASPAPAQQGGGQRGRAMEQLAQSLELTPEQQTAAREAFQNAMQNAERPGPDAAPGERRALMRRIREQVLRELEPSFTPRQRELLAQLRAGGDAPAEVRRSAVVWVLREGRPQPVQVEIGVADNSHTLLFGGLEEGDEVITGGGPREQNTNSPAPGPGGMRIRGA